MNFPNGSGALRQLSVRPRTFCQLSLRQHNLPSIFAIFPCIHWTFCKLASTFCASEKFPSIFCASMGPSVNFCQLSLSPRDIPSTSVKFLWFHGIFHQHLLHSWDVLSTSVNFPCIHSTFHQLPSTFRAPTESSVNNMGRHRTFHQHQSIFRASAGLPYTCVNFS